MATDQGSRALALLAGTTRRAILEHLCRAPHAVSELAAKLPVSRSAVSQHLKILKREGLVSDGRSGKRRIYSADPSALSQVAEYAATLRAQAGTPKPGSTAIGDASLSADDASQAQDQSDRIDRMFAHWPGMAGHDAAAVSLITRFLLIGRIMEKLLARACAEHGITKVDTIILGTLSRLPAPHESAPTQLSRIAVLSPPGITRRLDHLEHRKLIVRLAGSGDRRTQVIRLTARGRRVNEEIMRHNLLHNYAAVYALRPDERTQLNRSLRHLLREFEARL